MQLGWAATGPYPRLKELPDPLKILWDMKIFSGVGKGSRRCASENSRDGAEVQSSSEGQGEGQGESTLGKALSKVVSKIFSLPPPFTKKATRINGTRLEHKQ